jgi:hypothetical protein
LQIMLSRHHAHMHAPRTNHYETRIPFCFNPALKAECPWAAILAERILGVCSKTEKIL